VLRRRRAVPISYSSCPEHGTHRIHTHTHTQYIYIYIFISMSKQNEAIGEIHIYTCISMSKYKYTHMYKRVDMYTYICISMSMCIYTYVSACRYVYIYICISMSMCPPATGKYPTSCSVAQLGQHETHFSEKTVLDTRCRVQLENFQYNMVLW